MYLSKNDIKKMVENGNNGKYSHCIIFCDKFDYDYFPRYVEYSDRVEDVISKTKSLGSVGMYSVEEIYNYNLDIKKQLDEVRAYHIDPKKNENKVSLEIDNDKVLEAYEFANKMHDGIYRTTGEPYINHPIRVANILKNFKKSSHIDELVMCAYLHDTIEDTETTYYDIVKGFGSLVASIVSELTTDEDLKNELGKTKYLEIKMKNMTSWALTLKLCDRLDNCSDLENCDPAFMKKYSNETIDILEFLTKNRKLSKTQVAIIKEIVAKLFPIVDKNNKDRLEKIKNIIINITPDDISILLRKVIEEF